MEYDQGNRHPGNDAAARAYGLLMAQAAADYTTLEVEHTDIWNSDYMPFEAKGYACIGAYEGGENPYYHKSTDVAGADRRELPRRDGEGRPGHDPHPGSVSASAVPWLMGHCYGDMEPSAPIRASR